MLVVSVVDDSTALGRLENLNALWSSAQENLHRLFALAESLCEQMVVAI